VAERQLTLPGDVVKKSNALARAKWPIVSDYEPRLVALVASRVKKGDEDLKSYHIPVSDILGHEPGSKNRHRLKELVKSLSSKPLEIPQPNGGWAIYSVFAKCSYKPGDEYVEAQFHPDLLPHYLNLKGNFTRYNLMAYLAIPTGYSKRLFEVLKSWDDKPEVTIDLAELREMVGLAHDKMTRWVDFNRFVLERGQGHIKETTGFEFDYYPEKQGRTVCAVRFVFDKERRAKLEREEKAKANEKKVEALKAAFRCWKGRGRKAECQESNASLQCKMCRKNYLKETPRP
jgi:plasmid replication initiation protein